MERVKWRYIYALCFAITIAFFYFVPLSTSTISFSSSNPRELFDGFNNETGTANGCYIVPNYVHFIRFNSPELSFSDAVCILAAFKHQRPEKIFIHTNVKPTGKYWDVVKSVPGVTDVLDFRNQTLPTSIFGQQLSEKWRVYHGGDVARIRIMMEFGGIYLDQDSYVIRSLDVFRKFEFTANWWPGENLRNQIVVTHKDARFLRVWLESYRNNYRPSRWYYNAGEHPGKLLVDRPYLIHRVPELFGSYDVVKKLFMTKWKEWRAYYAIHLLIRHQYLFKTINENATYPVEFNDSNIHNYPIAFRDMVYDVYPYPPNTTFQTFHKD